MTLQKQIIKSLHVQSVISPKTEIRKRIDFLKHYLKKAGAKGFVLGISGGQDSTLAGRLAQLAVQESRNEGYEATLIAVRLPYNVQVDEADAQLALKFIKPDQSVVFNIASTVDVLSNQYNNLFKGSLTDFNKGNVKARMRMVTQYAIAGQQQLLVIGTTHAAEAITGFYTKFGDGGVDLLPLTGLTKSQGRALLQELDAEEHLYLKMPTADLLDGNPGQSDEIELGVTYEQLDDYLEGKIVPKQIAEKIEKRYMMNKHKRQKAASMFDEWWK